jgi:hypothetical protein
MDCAVKFITHFSTSLTNIADMVMFSVLKCNSAQIQCNSAQMIVQNYWHQQTQQNRLGWEVETKSVCCVVLFVNSQVVGDRQAKSRW